MHLQSMKLESVITQFQAIMPSKHSQSLSSVTTSQSLYLNNGSIYNCL